MGKWDGIAEGQTQLRVKGQGDEKNKKDLFSKAGMGRSGQELGYKELCRPHQRVWTLC